MAGDSLLGVAAGVFCWLLDVGVTTPDSCLETREGRKPFVLTLKQITVMINVLLGVNYCPHQPIMTRDQRVIRGHIRTNESEGPDNLPLTAAFISDRLHGWRGQGIIGRDELLLKQKNL